MADIPQPILTFAKDTTLVGNQLFSNDQSVTKTFKAGTKISMNTGLGDNTVIYVDANNVRYEIPDSSFVENPISVVAVYQQKVQAQQAAGEKVLQQKLANQNVLQKTQRYATPYIPWIVISAVGGGLFFGAAKLFKANGDLTMILTFVGIASGLMVGKEMTKIGSAL